MSVEDSESHRFQTNISLSVSQADLASTFRQELFFLLKKKSIYFVEIHAHSQRYRNITADIFGIQTVFGKIVFPLVSALLIARLLVEDASKIATFSEEKLGVPVVSVRGVSNYCLACGLREPLTRGNARFHTYLSTGRPPCSRCRPRTQSHLCKLNMWCKASNTVWQHQGK